MPKPLKPERSNQGAAFRAEARRRDLCERYPHIPARAWNNMGSGLHGAGLQGLRAWLRSLRALVAREAHAVTPNSGTNDE